VPIAEGIRPYERAIGNQYNQSSNFRGSLQILTTLGPFLFIWWIALLGVDTSLWITAGCVPLLALFSLRVFALLHECGHGSLFRSPRLNRAAGFVLGVVSGMPQYVWSQNHAYHHAHNGNWEKYRGPYTTRSTDEYAAMTSTQQRLYRIKCSAGAAPIVGFIYLIFNPRYTWFVGSMGFLAHIGRRALYRLGLSATQPAETFKTRYWKNRKEYWHMSANNIVLLSIWLGMSYAWSPLTFFTIYLVSLSMAGAAGIILFTVQHNFEHSYATDCDRWDYATGAMQGTAYLVLPAWLNWFTADMGYHHIHHLSAKIPNYRLAECHDDHSDLFIDVTRIRLSQMRATLKCILWDISAQRIISIGEYRQPVPAG
jgi:omega-6 fatty acid desaturase (delta-12 desaturase)